MNIIDFLTARLEEDADAAQAAITAQEEIYPAPGFEVRYEWSRRTRHVSGGGGVEPVPGAPSPSQVLREVAAKRKLIHEYQEARQYYTHHPMAPAGEITGLHTAIKLAASANANHPDYPEATAR